MGKLQVKRERPSIKEQAKLRKDNELYLQKTRNISFYEDIKLKNENLRKKKLRADIRKKHKKCAVCDIDFCTITVNNQKCCSEDCDNKYIEQIPPKVKVRNNRKERLKKAVLKSESIIFLLSDFE